MAQLFQDKPGRFDWVLRLLVVAAVGVLVMLGVLVWQELMGRTEMETALAQPPEVFSSGSTGADGALEYTTPGTYVFNPRTLGIDPEGDNVFHFTTITIVSGVTVTLSGQDINGPVYWLASGPVQIDGMLDLSGENGHPHTINPTDRHPSIPGPGGYSGGVGKYGSNAQSGLGPGGGCAWNSTYYGSPAGNAGHANIGSQGGCSFPGESYGNVFLLPLVGGSGGGGNGNASVNTYGGGGAGGGAITIASSLSILVNGSVLAGGGNGGTSVAGGGSGGAIHLMSPVLEGTGDINAQGGLRGSTTAGIGRIRIDTFDNNFTGTSNPTPVLGVPYMVILPENPPQVRVVAVTGAAGSVPEYPTGSYNQPDVTVDTTGPVTLTVVANYVPVGSMVQLYIYSETGADQIINSTPLAGTLMTSTATIMATFPAGPSRMFVRSDWTP